MASNVVRVSILSDAQRFKAGFSDADKATESFGARVTKVGTLVAAALAVKALGAVKAFVGDSVRAFSDLNESLNALDVVYGKNAEGIKKLGKESARNLGLSNAEFNTFAVSISAFAEQIAGKNGDIVGTVDVLTKRITDFASVMNLDVAVAQEKFQSGLAGQSKPLREFAIDVSDARVKAFALANGIGEVGRELTEAEKVQARYGTIMEQTDKVQGDFLNTVKDYANAQRVANAESENAKARIGELLVPVAQLGNQLKLTAAQGLSLFATAISEVTGKLTHVQAVMQQYEQLSGATADTLEFAVGVNQRYGVSFEELFEQMTFAEGGLKRLSKENESYLRQIGYTQDEIDELNRLIGVEMVKASNDARDAGRHHKGGLEDQTDAMGDLGDETEDTTSAMRAQFDLIDGRLDTFGKLTKATKDQAEKQAIVNKMVEDGTTDTPEYIEALEDLAEANRDLKDAEIEVIDAGGLTRDEFIKQQIALGLTFEQARILAEKYNELFTPRSVTHTITVNNVTKGNPGRVPGRAGGGFVLKGNTYPINEEDQEFFTPSVNGRVHQNRAEAPSGGGIGTPSGDVYININAGMGSDPNAIGKAVLEALQRYQRQNGALPLRVRG
jgi:hypothetical protein